jgi:hypothetical protein
MLKSVGITSYYTLVNAGRDKEKNYSPDLYDEFRSFYQQIVKADKLKLVFKNST